MNNEARTPAGLVVSPDQLEHALTEEQKREMHNGLVDLFIAVREMQDKGFGVCSGQVPEPFNGLVCLPPELIPFYEAFLTGKVQKIPAPEETPPSAATSLVVPG